MAEIRTAVFAVAEIRTPVIQAGPEDAREVVVFVHGNPGSRLDWEALVAATGDFARAVAFDLPGFGTADKPGSFPYTVEAYAEFLSAALDRLGVERAHVVVHDFGGPWSFAWAAREPDRLVSAVIFNTGVLLGRWHSTARRWRTPLLGEITMLVAPYSVFARALTLDGRVPLPETFLRRMHRDFDRRTRRAILRLYRATDMPYPPAREWVSALGPLDRPALVVWGDRDPFSGPDAIDQLKLLFPSAEVVHLPDSGHFPFADDPKRSAEAVIPFLRRVTGA